MGVFLLLLDKKNEKEKLLEEMKRPTKVSVYNDSQRPDIKMIMFLINNYRVICEYHFVNINVSPLISSFQYFNFSIDRRNLKDVGDALRSIEKVSPIEILF